MQYMELSAGEIETLRELIERRLAELEIEIDRTDTHDFKENLKRQRTMLRQVTAKLARTPVTA
jgi:hypothetical protein